jgi:hypothetical protein
MIVTDKFPTPSFGIYKYRGIRNENSPGTTGTRTLVRKTVDCIIDSLSADPKSISNFSTLLCEIGFLPSLEICYRVRYADIFLTGNLLPEILDDIYDNWTKYFHNRINEIWGASFYNKIRKNRRLVSAICDYLNKYAAQRYRRQKSFYIEYDIFDNNNTLVADSNVIKALSSLDILTYPEVKVRKVEMVDGYEFTGSSSGETQQLFQFISVMSAIDENSLVVIDEPENSSHPNWQIHYIDWVQRIFSRFKGCHFVIATHSHFLLTDLNPKWGKVIALDYANREIVDIAAGTNTFCWSTDDILYRVFHIRNTRNYVFESKMHELYGYISKREMNTPEAQSLLNEMKQYVLNHDDPLNKLIEIAENAEA